MGTRYAGKDAYSKVDSVRYPFSEWTLDMETDAVVVAVFDDDGFDDNLEGRSRATLTLSGPYNTDDMPFTSGYSYDFVLGVGGSGVDAVEFPVTARITKITAKTATASREPAGVTIQAMVRGTFTKGIA